MVSQIDQRNRAVGATLVSRYYRLLMTNPEQLTSMYLPKAQFAHDSRVQDTRPPAHSGLDNIRRALHAAYGSIHNGHVAVSSMEVNKSTERAPNLNQFVVVVSGTMHFDGADAGRSFKHLIEIQEHHHVNSGVFGIWADTLRFVAPEQQAAAKLDWAAFTPPMDAKTAPVEEIPPVEIAPAVSTSAAAAPSAKKPAASQQKPQAPAAAAQLKQDVMPPKDEAPASAAAAAAAPAPTVAEEKPKAPTTYAELLRAKTSGAGSTAKPAQTVVAAGPVEAKKKEPTGASASAAAAAPKEEAAPKRREKEGDAAETSTAAAPASGKTAAAGNEGRKREGGHSRTVVFYHAFINNLSPKTTEADLRGVVEPFAKINEIKLENKPSKTDAKVIRTFAFIKFDRGVTDIAGTIAKIKSKKIVLHEKEMNIDEVREKFDKTDVRGRGDKDGAAKGGSKPSA